MEYIIIFLPLVGSIISSFFGKNLKYNEYIISFLVLISAILSIFIFYEVVVNDYSSNKLIFNWLSSGDFKVYWCMLFTVFGI